MNDCYKLGQIQSFDIDRLKAKVSLAERCELVLYTENDEPVMLQGPNWRAIAEILDYCRSGQAYQD